MSDSNNLTLVTVYSCDGACWHVDSLALKKDHDLMGYSEFDAEAIAKFVAQMLQAHFINVRVVKSVKTETILFEYDQKKEKREAEEGLSALFG